MSAKWRRSRQYPHVLRHAPDRRRHGRCLPSGPSSSSPRVKKNSGPSEYKTTIMGIPEAGNSGFEGLMNLDVEAYAMGKVSGENVHGIRAGKEGIWRETEFTQIFAFRE